MRSLLFLLALPALRAEIPTAQEIMRKVAANQDASLELRSAYVYHQKVRVRSLDTKGKVRHEQTTEYTVLPGPQGTRRETVSLNGRYLKNGNYLTYQTVEPKSDIDLNIVHDLRDELTGDSKSRDGINHSLFPLTTAEIARYSFDLKGEEKWQGQRAYRIAFKPLPTKGVDVDSSTGPWEGEALIHADEFQPVEIHTQLAQKIPAAVRVMLGTSLHGLGFSVRYQKAEGGAWFPVSYGTEFSVRVLFGWARTLTVAMDNSEFRKADVSSSIQFAEPMD